MNLEASFLGSINDINAAQWDSLFGSSNPFISHAFLKALEDSGCVSSDNGWQPSHLVLKEADEVVAVMPLYLKSHSYGEFVFDWGWAESYSRHGMDYYPKLLSAIPFTPSTGPRLGLKADLDSGVVMSAVINAVQSFAAQQNLSGWHLLFPREPEAALAAQQDSLLKRQDVQFHWHNRGYAEFDDFLGDLRSRRRRNLRKERARVAGQGIVMRRKTGSDISARDWQHFYQCYVNTYLKRSGHEGYLDRGFFDRLLDVMRESLLLVVAERDGATLACSLFLFDDEALYGRYWGAQQDISCLHFEACFYQGIEFCIERGLQTFDPGTQGEHKLLRGFEPVKTCSFHWLADHRFQAAIDDYLKKERPMTEDFGQRAEDFLPFKRPA